jgi:putative transposase
MPRANRYHLAGHVWHLTERCHRKLFLLKFARDRRAWVSWLYEARRRYGLSVLNYQVTSNHVHLLVLDRGTDEIAQSMQLIAGCVGRAYNRRKRRPGAFWEDCYHATAVDTDEHLARCFTYIDLNMVRAGVVEHPRQWPEAGYREIQAPPQLEEVARHPLEPRHEIDADSLSSPPTAGPGCEDAPLRQRRARDGWVSCILGFCILGFSLRIEKKQGR